LPKGLAELGALLDSPGGEQFLREMRARIRQIEFQERRKLAEQYARAVEQRDAGAEYRLRLRLLSPTWEHIRRVNVFHKQLCEVEEATRQLHARGYSEHIGFDAATRKKVWRSFSTRPMIEKKLEAISAAREKLETFRLQAIENLAEVLGELRREIESIDLTTTVEIGEGMTI